MREFHSNLLKDICAHVFRGGGWGFGDEWTDNCLYLNVKQQEAFRHHESALSKSMENDEHGGTEASNMLNVLRVK